MKEYQYELKCRRCGKIRNYISHIETYGKFDEFIGELLKRPPDFHCVPCQMIVVGDVVSYSDKNGHNNEHAYK